MNLDTYLRAEGIKGTEFSARIGVSEVSLSRIRRGDQNISRELIRRIVAATNGAVTAEDLVFHGASDTPAPGAAPTGQSGNLSGGVVA